MKICWDNLENVRYNKDTETFRKNRITYYEKKCEVCGDYYLGQKKNKFCGDECRLSNHSKERKYFKHSSETKEKISEKLKNKRFTEDHKEKISNSLRGRRLSKHHRDIISEKAKSRYLDIRKHPNYDGGYSSKNIPKYDLYFECFENIEPIQRNKSDKNILEVKCTYCGRWYIPSNTLAQRRKLYINGIVESEYRFYCSEKCKNNCSIYGQVKYPKYQKPTTAREVQPELAEMVFARDNYTCQKCNTHKSQLECELHCHHKEGILWEPLQSADMDMCITFCENCHKKVHQIPGCTYYELRCA